jgi:hypothetical protein
MTSTNSTIIDERHLGHFLMIWLLPDYSAGDLVSIEVWGG